MADDKEKILRLADKIRHWVDVTGGWFVASDIDKELGIYEEKSKAYRRVILHRLVKDGVLQHHPTKDSVFRRTSEEAPEINWRDADPNNWVDIIWPFDLHKLVRIYPKSIVICAGDKNAGKTAWMLNIIYLNQHRIELAEMLPIQYFTNEMSPEELKDRLLCFPSIEWSFVAKERTSQFADVIVPSGLNLIDYLSITNEFWLVAEEINSIWNKLTTGIAVIALQKDFGATWSRGKLFSAEKARLYITLSQVFADGRRTNQLEILVAKKFVDPEVNPNHKKWQYGVMRGWKFINIKPLSRED